MPDLANESPVTGRDSRVTRIAHAGLGPTAFGYPVLGLAGFIVAAFLGMGLALGILRSGRL